MAQQFDPRRIPIIGDDIYQVGQVIDIWGDGCSPQPSIFIRGFFEYTPLLLWSLFKPDPFDLVFDRLGQRHKRKRRRRFRVKDFDALGGPKIPGERGFMYQSIKLVQRIGWYLIIVDATSDFLINWTSMAYQWSGCPAPSPGSASFWGPTGFRISSGVPITVQLRGNQNAKQGAANATNSNVQINTLGPKQGTGSASLHLEPRLGVTGEITRVFMRVVYLNNVTKDIDFKPEQPGENPGKWTGQLRDFAANLGFAHYRMYATFTVGRLYIDDITLSASGAPNNAIEFDP